MKHIATLTLMLHFGVLGIYADPGPVNITVSGTSARSTTSLGGTPAGEYQLDGDGTLGPLTVRVLSTGMTAPQISTTCSGPTKVYFASKAGAAVFRFQDGGLLTGILTGGGDCVDFAAGAALCTRIFQVIGGSGRFTNASGTLTLTMTVVPVLADGSPTNPVFFAVTGGVTGNLAGVAADQVSQDGQ